MLKLRRADDSSSSREGAGEGEEEGKRGRAVRAWEEICVMSLGGMVQSEVAKGISVFLLPSPAFRTLRSLCQAGVLNYLNAIEE